MSLCCSVSLAALARYCKRKCVGTGPKMIALPTPYLEKCMFKPFPSFNNLSQTKNSLKFPDLDEETN